MLPEQTHIYMLELAPVGSFNGVARCIETLTQQMPCQVTWLRITYGQGCQQTLCQHSSSTSFHCYSLPYPLGEFLTDEQKRMACWYEIQGILFPVNNVREPCIYHVHTLNLIELAVVLKKQWGGSIVTHLHCLPWKTLFDKNTVRYNRLYHRYYHTHMLHPVRDFVLRDYEAEAYRISDAIVCVTQCAQDFLRNLGVPPAKVHVVYNGLPDMHPGRGPGLRKTQTFTILYVGNANPSKGLGFLLEALAQLRDKAFRLVIIGDFNFGNRENILASYPNMDIQFAGKLSLPEMANYYATAHIGVIPSIHEQCSCVAIEMMMHAVPVICSQTDGLKEMFQHGVNALLVPLVTPVIGRHSVDTSALAASISVLQHDAALRATLAHGSRQTFLERFTEHTMMQQILQIYSSIII